MPLTEQTHYTTDDSSPDTDDRRIKQRYEDLLIAGLQAKYPGYNKEIFVEEVYSRGCWIRRLARFVMDGTADPRCLQKFKCFDEEWNSVWQLQEEH